MNAKAKTSLVIAAYKRSGAIKPTLDSVLVQSQPVDEIIVVDDGSPDDTASFVAANYPTVRVLTKPNGGTSSARNYGARAATGDLLIFLDHDDLLLPKAVETLTGLLREFPDAQAAHCDHEYHNLATGIVHLNHHSTLPSFGRLKQIASLAQTSRARLYGRALYSSLLEGNILQQPFAVRRNAFFEAGGYTEDIRYCEDWDLYLRLTASFPVVVADDVISQHIIEGENLHLTAIEKQETMYAAVLTRQLKSLAWNDWRERMTIRKKLSIQHKTRGDRAKSAGDHAGAWRCYCQSAAWWPNDMVTLARLLLWSPVFAGRARL